MNGGQADVVQATAWYPPHSIGGTEAYVEDLVDALAARDVVSSILVPAAPDSPGSYMHAGRVVETYPVDRDADRAEIMGRVPPRQFVKFQDRLRAHPGAIYHQHSWTRGCGGVHLRAARELGMKTVLTIHVPGAICLRGTLLRFGESICDGQVQDRACGACWAHGRGLPKLAATCVSHLPLAAARQLRHGQSRIATALAARALGAERISQLRDIAADADRIVVVCRWLQDALAINGVPAGKVVLSRQGLSSAFVDSALSVAPEHTDSTTLRLLFLGRMDSLKGIDIAISAVRAAKANVSLTIRAANAQPENQFYETKVRGLANGDPRIRFECPVARQDVLAELHRHDALAVPSVWLETGPLVVLEAQAAGLFVLGSRLGGIAELVKDGIDGELVTAGDVAAWTRSIEKLAKKKALGQLIPRRQRVRTMPAVAEDMIKIYEAL